MKYLVGLICTICSAFTTQGQDTLKYCTDHGVGLGGYDAVSYFNENQPLKGDLQIYSIVDRVKYLFASEKNKALFESNPERYLPAFGGWCSMTLVMGVATQPVYENFLIKNDKLYLFERTLSVDGKLLWLQNHQKNKAIAEENYNQYKATGKIQ